MFHMLASSVIYTMKNLPKRNKYSNYCGFIHCWKKKNPRKGAINAYIFIFKGTSYIKYLFKKNITGIYMEHLPVR